MAKRSRPVPMILPAQLALLAVAAVILAAWPPRTGRMMLVPLAGANGAETVRVASATGALLLGRGPWRSSYVVDGDRAAIVSALPAGVIVVAAPATGCGPTEDVRS